MDRTPGTALVIAMLQWPHDPPVFFFNSKSETSLTDVVCELCFEMVGNESILVPLT